MKRAFLFLFVLAVALPAMATTVYRWVGSDGVVHYSDQPHAGAVKVNLGAPQVVNFKTPPPVEPVSPPPGQQDRKHREYRVRILAPADGTTLRPANHEIQASVSVSPPLGASALLQYSLDGNPLGKPTAANQVLIQRVYRGTHHLTATVLVPGGASAGTATSTFYVHQNSILLNRHNRPGPHPGPGGGGG
ncbi:MAG: DUF4124 domain-containing protein [Gammaproteobacteria bacterium]